MNGHTIWLTGIPDSGKETIADRIAKEIREIRNLPVILLDSKIVRKTLSFDLGYSRYDEEKHVLRVANVCYLISANGIINIASVNSPNKRIRSYAKSLIKDFTEVFVKCSEEAIIERQLPGLHSNVDIYNPNRNFEEPYRPNLVLDTEKNTISECTNRLISYLEERGII